MIARVWHGWTSARNADAYEHHLRTTVFPGIHRIKGYKGAHLFRRQDGEEVEFVATTYFESIEAVRGFAGPEYGVAVISEEAAKLLSRYDQRAEHYTVVLEPEAVSGKG
jgi:heme-degrading monooxygenase HmoA